MTAAAGIIHVHNEELNTEIMELLQVAICDHTADLIMSVLSARFLLQRQPT